MFNGHKISKLLEERHLKKKSLIEYMQTYPSGLDAIIKDGNPRADTLEKIADFFRLPIDYFFDRNIEISDLSPLITGNGNKIQHGDGNIMIETQAKEIEHLQQLLADFQVYYTNLRGFHWNIKGHDFFVLHSQFEKMYDDTAEKVDEIAERILMLGGTPANKFSDYLKVANISEVDKVSNGEQALNNILQSISYLIGEERKILSIASQAGDEVTVSMMSDYLKEQEKLVWMLTAYNSK